MKYFAAVEGDEYVIGIGEADELTVNDTPRSAQLEGIDTESHFSLLVGPRSFDVFVERARDGYAVTVGGERYLVQVADARGMGGRLRGSKGSQRAEGPAGAAVGTTGAGARDAEPDAVASPMTGVLIEILANVGQVVEAGEGVAILEAMKTENVVRAPRGGTVKSIEASTGQSLRMDEVIMVLQPAQDQA